MSSLYWHTTPVKVKGTGPMGLWLELQDGSTELVPSSGKPFSECVSDKPRDVDGECKRCGFGGVA